MSSLVRFLFKTLEVIVLVICCIDGHPRTDAQVNLSRLMSDRELEIYSKARTVVDMTAEELLQAFPEECRDLEFDKNQEHLPSLLREVGENVAAFVRDIPNTTSREQVRRERLRNNLTAESSSTQDYNYLVLPGIAGPWEEIRTDSKGRPLGAENPQNSYFMTSGFAGLALFFHSDSLPGSRFRLLGRERREPKNYLIAFAQRPENATPTGQLRTPLFLEPALIMYQGMAWVDSGNHQIVRMRTDLLAPRRDVYLSRQTTEIWYGEVRFATSAHAFWLPRDVLVTIVWAGQAYRNRHRYSDYLVFTVESRDKLEQPKIKK